MLHPLHISNIKMSPPGHFHSPQLSLSLEEIKKKPMENKETEVAEEPEFNYRGLKVMPFILGNETFEKLGALGTLSNLLVYLTTVFNLKRITATTLLNVFNGTTNIATLPGAYLSDTYFGRYRTLAFCSVTTFLGLFVVALTAVFKALHPPRCLAKEQSQCISPSKGQMVFLLSGFALMVIGAAGVRPCNLAFGADQFNPKTESGKKSINSFFNWYYFTLTLAQMISVTAVVYVQSKIWSVGLMIPAICMLVACILFFVGTKMYVKVKPEGNPFATSIQVIVAAVKKRNLKLPEQPSRNLFRYTPSKSIISNLSYTEQFRFLNKAAIVTEEDQVNSDGLAVNPWRLCSIQQVEELKCIIRVIPIWASAIIYHIAIIQQQQYVVFQALQSDRRLGKFTIPAATYTIFSLISLTIFIPIYDQVLVPWLRRLTGKENGITLLQRIGVGIVLSILSSFISVLIEQKRRQIALTKPTLGYEGPNGAISSMSAFWLVPQLCLAGTAEAFSAIGFSEFYYKQFPENMKSVAGSLLFCGFAASSYLNSFLISIIHRSTKGAASGNWLPEDLNKGTLDYFYYLITALGVINLVYFLLCSKWYRYKGTGDSTTVLKMETREEVDNHLV